jgi:hypothetical protein
VRLAAATQASRKEHDAIAPSSARTVSEAGSIAIAWANASSHAAPSSATSLAAREEDRERADDDGDSQRDSS